MQKIEHKFKIMSRHFSDNYYESLFKILKDLGYLDELTEEDKKRLEKIKEKYDKEKEEK